METKIKALDTTFGEFHKTASDAYFIPSLQRPYTWDKKEIEKFWDDILDNEPGYYIGSIVAIVDGGTISRDQIIDGQQRLTTLSLFLVGIRDYIQNKTSEEYKLIAEDLDNLLVKYGRDNKQIRLSFFDENSRKMYEALVFKNEMPSQPTNNQKKFIKNIKNVNDNIKKYSPKCRINEIRSLVDKIKKIQLIFIKCSDRTSAFNLFESINATGISLATTDLLKNALFEALHNSEKDYKYIESGWKKMFETFSEDSSYLKTYIRHHWISTVGYISHAGLFDAFLKEYKDEELSYAKSLFDLANVYLSIRDARTESLDKLTTRRYELSEIKETLSFLSFLGVDQVYSVLLYIYKNDTSQFIKDLNKLTAFQFLYKYVPGSPSVPEKKFFANFCEGRISRQELFNGLFGLCVGQEQQFIENFNDRVKYVEGKSGDIQFVLEKIIYKEGGINKFAEPTIEHIIPQDGTDSVFKKFKSSKDEAYKKIHSIGNLTVVEKTENSSKSIFNQHLKEKIPHYKNHQVTLNQKIVKDYDFLNDPDSSIKKRGDQISKLIYNLFLNTIKTGKWK